MTTDQHTISLSKAALIVGFAILILVIVAPFAEVYVYPKLIGSGLPEETFKNVTSHLILFTAAIFAYAITFAVDLIVSWALYILLKPVHANLSLLAALFRITFTVISIVALLDFVAAFRLVNDSDYLSFVDQKQVSSQLYLLLQTFRYGYHFAIIYFSIHLGLIGYLIFRSGYIPKTIGIILMISAVGYLTSSLKPFLFPDLNMSYVTVTFFGELIFMLWLLIRGHKIKQETRDSLS